MNAFHLSVLRRIPGAEVKPSADPSVLGRTGAALCAKLRRDAWPYVGVRCLSLTLADGTRYTPSIVTVDDGIVVAWEPAEGTHPFGRAWPAPVAHLLPEVESPAITVQFVAAYRLGRGWVEDDVQPRRAGS